MSALAVFMTVGPFTEPSDTGVDPPAWAHLCSTLVNSDKNSFHGNKPRDQLPACLQCRPFWELPYHTWPAGAAISTCVVFPSRLNPSSRFMALGDNIWVSSLMKPFLLWLARWIHSESSAFSLWSKLKTRQPDNDPSWMGSFRKQIFTGVSFVPQTKTTPKFNCIDARGRGKKNKRWKEKTIKLRAPQELFWCRDPCESSWNPQYVRQDLGKSQNEDSKALDLFKWTYL